jgi:glycosyltransferase involved in cell wall biosynthesis
VTDAEAPAAGSLDPAPAQTSWPRVAALMPACNGAAFIEATLASLRAQTYPALEVVISDDASTDGTAAICAAAVRGDARFRLLRQPARRGWIGNSNALLAASDAPLCFFAFHDDPLDPTYVMRLAVALAANANAVLAFSDVRVGEHVYAFDALDGVTDRIERGRRMIGKQGRWWIPNRGLFRAAAARAAGGLRRHLAGEYSADWPWLVYLALRGEFVRVPAPLIRKVFREGSVSNRWKGTRWQALAVALSCARAIGAAPLDVAERAMLWRELAWRSAQAATPHFLRRSPKGYTDG